MTTTNIGVPTGGKPINLRQLEGELGTAGVTVNALGMGDDLVYTYDSEGVPADLPAGSDAVIVAPGFSCRTQIKHFTGRTALHPAELLGDLLLSHPTPSQGSRG